MTLYRPGCFGSPLCHQAAALMCDRCPHLEACGQEAARCATALNGKYGIARVRWGRMPAGAVNPAKATLTQRAAHLRKEQRPLRNLRTEQGVRRHMADHGIDLARALRDKINPFETAGPTWMRLAFDETVAGRASLESLIRAIQTALPALPLERAQLSARIALAILGTPTLDLEAAQ